MINPGRDGAFALLALLVAVVAGYVAFGYAADSSWFPRVLCIFLGATSLLLFVRSVRRQVSDEIDASLRATVIVFGAGILYAVSIQFVSFEIVNFLFLVAAMYLLGQRNPIVVTVVAVGVMLLVKLLFFEMLDVPRPDGVLF